LVRRIHPSTGHGRSNRWTRVGMITSGGLSTLEVKNIEADTGWGIRKAPSITGMGWYGRRPGGDDPWSSINDQWKVGRVTFQISGGRDHGAMEALRRTTPRVSGGRLSRENLRDLVTGGAIVVRIAHQSPAGGPSRPKRRRTQEELGRVFCRETGSAQYWARNARGRAVTADETSRKGRT